VKNELVFLSQGKSENEILRSTITEELKGLDRKVTPYLKGNKKNQSSPYTLRYGDKIYSNLNAAKLPSVTERATLLVPT